MPDETGTEAARSDAPSDYESLFGEAADDAANAVAEEQDANEETEQDPQGADDAGEDAGQPEDLKVVVSIKGGRATIGVQRPSSDPHIETFDDQDLAGLDTGGLGGGRKGKSQVGRRTQVSGSHKTRSPGQPSVPGVSRVSAQAGTAEGEDGRPAAARDAEAFLVAGAASPNPPPSRCSSGRSTWSKSGSRSAR